DRFLPTCPLPGHSTTTQHRKLPGSTQLSPPPHLTFAILITDQHAQQLAHVQPIAFGPTLASIDVNGGGIHHGVGDPLRLQQAMQPEAFTTRFRATHHGSGFREAKALFGLGSSPRLCGRGRARASAAGRWLPVAGERYYSCGGWKPARIQIDRASTMRDWFMRNRTIVALPVGVKPRRT